MKLIYLAIVASLALGLYLYKNEFVPPHLSNDEISVAYDAYSVSRTMRDEHNQFLPVSFESNVNAKAPLYDYLAITPIRLLGNTATAARIPSAIAGALTVFISGLLVYQTSRKLSLALLTATTLTFTPWLIHSSHTALETNMALAMTTIFVFAFMRWRNHPSVTNSFSTAVMAALSMYAYHTQWGFIPLLGVVLVMVFPNTLRNKKLFLVAVIFGLCITPLGLDYLTNSITRHRAANDLLWYSVRLRDLPATSINHYLSHFDPGWLFFSGMNLFEDLSPYRQGLFLPPLVFLFGIGLVAVFRKSPWSDLDKLALTWLFLAPVVPSLTKGEPSTSRYLIVAIPIAIFIATGWWELWQARKQLRTKIVGGGLVLATIFSLFYFWVIYFYQFPHFSGINYQYGYQQITEYLKTVYPNPEVKTIVVESRFGPYNRYDGLPHLYIPYFLPLHPSKLQHKRTTLTSLYYDKFEETNINWSTIVLMPNAIYVTSEANLPPAHLLPNLVEKKIIYLPSGERAFEIFQARP